MTKNKQIIYFSIAIIIIGVIVLSFFNYKSDKNLHIYFLDVGQGDSEYVRRMNNFDLLIDCGPNNSVVNELGKIMPFWDRKIDYLLLTHPHADHLSGCIDIIKRYEIGQIIATDAVNTSSEYLEWLKLISDKHIPYKLARAEQEINLDNEIKLNIYRPNKSYKDEKIDNLNNTSIVAKLIYHNFSVLFAGDAEAEAQKELLRANGQSLKADVLKVAHHGSNNGSDINFLKAVLPKIGVISVGRNNKFGHPAPDTLKKLESIGAKIYRTDQNGTIEITSDGIHYQINSKQ